jgi:DNA helicase II / ATP-dependent DNA helicase PcrA
MVDKRLILAVAGSGKTRFLIDRLNLEDRFIIIAYTNTSLNLINSRIAKRFSYHPNNIKTQTYFEFLYGFCIRPFVLFKYSVKGINWEDPPEFTTYLSNTDLNKYITKGRYLYHNRLGKFVEFENIIEDIKARLEKFYDYLYFDEFQDLGGHDFNFVTNIVQANINFLFVGDFFQNTYVTSYDGKLNVNLYSDLVEYCNKLKKSNIYIDTKTLGNSFRCSPTICDFIRQNLGIEIRSNRNDGTEIILVSNKKEAFSIISDDKIIKLVYDKSNEKNFISKNWGECKGEDDYNDTCIILNKTTSKLLSKNKLNELAPRTKNKFYVALTRTRGNCFFIDEDLLK